jgi:hypothetical protein
MSQDQILSNIQVASPCHESWDGMHGDGRVRFCNSCQKRVYNLSALSAEQATSVIRQHEGNLCVRLFLRRDGTVLTQDCPIGSRRLLVRASRFGKTASALALLTVAGFVVPNLMAKDPALRSRVAASWNDLVQDLRELFHWNRPQSPPLTGKMVMGGCAPPIAPPPAPLPLRNVAPAESQPADGN